MKYIKPHSDLIKFTCCDVVTTSDGTANNGSGYTDNETGSNIGGI